MLKLEEKYYKVSSLDILIYESLLSENEKYSGSKSKFAEQIILKFVDKSYDYFGKEQKHILLTKEMINNIEKYIAIKLLQS